MAWNYRSELFQWLVVAGAPAFITLLVAVLIPPLTQAGLAGIALIALLLLLLALLLYLYPTTRKKQ